MHIHMLEVRDLSDLGFAAVNDVSDHGRRFVIYPGPYARQTRPEHDYFSGKVNYAGTQPLIPAKE